jgi:fermentation-respiration switch protein FrsA (DUF1100 family)
MLDIVAVIAVAVGLLWAAQRALIYFPTSDLPSPAAAGLPAARVVTFETADGLTLEAWFLERTPGILSTFGYTVIVFNGNAGHRGHRAGLGAQLAGRGLNVLLVDYRGYGGNPGLPSEEGLARDARAALAYLGRRADVDPTRIVFFGESLGAAVALRLALEYPPAALVLRSPFTSLVEIGQHHYPFLPVRWLLRDRYPSLERIARVTSPLLIVAGEDDEIVPIANSTLLFDVAPHPKRFVALPGTDHNDDALAGGPILIRAIVDLLEGADAPTDEEA